MPTLWIVALLVLLLNLPFGFWRAGTRRFSWPWLLAVHAPVPLVIGLRLASGLGWKAVTFPIMIGAFFTGQYLGGRLRRSRRARQENGRPHEEGGRAVKRSKAGPS